MKINLINGESYLLINQKVNEIVGDNKNVTIFDMMINNVGDIILEAGYVSMFDEEKFIIVKNANFFGATKLKDEDNDKLLSYLNNPEEMTTIIFICNDKLDQRKKITKLIKEKYSLIVIPPLKYYEIENRVKDYLTKLGYKIDIESIKYIVQNNLNNYDVVMMEVNKLILYYDKPGYISYDDVVHITARSINTNNFLFVDSVVDNNLQSSLSLFHDLMLMKVEPLSLLALLARDFRIMLNIKILQEENKREYEIMNELGLLDWQLEKYLKKIFPYKRKELEEILVKIANIDLDIKSGKLDKYMAIELFILDICG